MVVVVVEPCLGVAVVLQEVFVASIMQLATSAQEMEGLGHEVFSPSPHKYQNIQIFKNMSEQGGFKWILTCLWHPWAAPCPPDRSSSRRSRNAEEHFSLSPLRSSGAAATGSRGLGTSLEGGNQGDHTDSLPPNSSSIPPAPRLAPGW